MLRKETKRYTSVFGVEEPHPILCAPEVTGGGTLVRGRAELLPLTPCSPLSAPQCKPIGLTFDISRQ